MKRLTKCLAALLSAAIFSAVVLEACRVNSSTIAGTFFTCYTC